MKPIKPKLQTLRRVLARHPYKGRTHETDSDQNIGLSFTELKRLIQASETELLNQINELHAVKIQRKWRLLDMGLLYSWVTYLDSILREKQLPLDEVTVEEVEDWMGLFEIKQVVIPKLNYISFSSVEQLNKIYETSESLYELSYIE